MRAMSLDISGKDEEENELHFLRERLDVTNNLVMMLSKQLEDLKDNLASKRKNDERISFRVANQ